MVDCFASFTDPSDPGPVVYPGDTITIPGKGIVDTYNETGSGSTSGACGPGAVTLTVNDAVAERIYTVVLNGYGTLTQLDATTWCWTPPSDEDEDYEDERDGSSIDIKIGEHILYTYVPHFCCRNGMTILGSTSVKPDSETEYTVVFSDPWSGCEYDWNATDGYIVGGTFIAPSTPGVVTISVTPFLADDMGEECATLDVTVESPCGGESIGYTTLQMNVNTSQTLTVVNPVAGKGYGWIASSGNIDATGLSVTYTAPSSNTNCVDNATITLTCDGETEDSITIAVNANATTAVAYAIKVLTTACWTNICDPPYTCYHAQSTTNAYKCDGTQPPDGYAGCINALGFGGDCNMRYGGACSCAWVAANTGPYFGVCPTVGYGTTDLRTALMKTQGCCPAQLM
jgi:hypothetical protein